MSEHCDAHSLPPELDVQELVRLTDVAAELGIRRQSLWARLQRTKITVHRTRVGTTDISAIARKDLPRVREIAASLPRTVPHASIEELDGRMELRRSAPEAPEREADAAAERLHSELQDALSALATANDHVGLERARNREIEARLSQLRADLVEERKSAIEERRIALERMEQIARMRSQLNRTISLQQATLNRFSSEIGELSAGMELADRIYRNNQRYMDRMERGNDDTFIQTDAA